PKRIEPISRWSTMNVIRRGMSDHITPSNSAKQRVGWLSKVAPWLFGWIAAAGGLIALGLTTLHPQLIAFRGFTSPGCYIAVFGFSVIAHELGHLVAARLLDLNPYAVIIGQGRTLIKKK